MSTLIEALSFEFMRNAVLVGVLASVLCGVIGTFVVVKRLVFISGGISHAAFGGLGLFYFLGLTPALGAVAVAVASSLILGLTDGGRARSQDAMIGVLWAVGMSVGIVLISRTPGYAPNLMTYLFGNILTVTDRDVLMTGALDVAVFLVLALFFKEFVAVAFDEVFARVQGVPVRALTTLLLILVALSIVVLIQVVGIILVIALLTIPPLISLMMVQDFAAVMVLSVVVGLVMTLGGLALSFRFDLPSGPAIILLGAGAMVLLWVAQALGRRSRRA